MTVIDYLLFLAEEFVPCSINQAFINDKIVEQVSYFYNRQDGCIFNIIFAPGEYKFDNP